MATWRVGEAGATIFDPDGRPTGRLAPGQVVVPGHVDTPGSLAQQHAHIAARRGYDDKVIRPDQGPRS
jgi:hypothetical protein